MKVYFGALFPLALVFQCAFAQPSEHKIGDEKAESRPGRINDQIGRGAKNVRRDFTVPLPVAIRSLDQATGLYDFIVAKPVDREIVITGDRPSITTWYKFRATNILLQNKPSSPSERVAADFSIVPQSFLPLGRMDFLMNTPGGRIVKEGVVLSSESTHPNEFKESERYLFILKFIDVTGKFAISPTIGNGIFRVDGDTLLPFVGPAENPLARDVRDIYGGSLKRLEAAIRSRSGR